MKADSVYHERKHTFYARCWAKNKVHIQREKNYYISPYIHIYGERLLYLSIITYKIAIPKELCQQITIYMPMT